MRISLSNIKAVIMAQSPSRLYMLDDACGLYDGIPPAPSTCMDSSGNGHHGQYYWPSRPGSVRHGVPCCQFAASSADDAQEYQAVRIPGRAPGGGAFTLCALALDDWWADVGTADPFPVSPIWGGKCSNAAQNPLFIAQSQSGLRYLTQSQSGSGASERINPARRWRFVAIAVGEDSAGSYFYVDGDLISANYWASTQPGTEHEVLGSAYKPGSISQYAPLIGSLSAVGMWNRMLQPSEMESIWLEAKAAINKSQRAVEQAVIFPNWVDPVIERVSFSTDILQSWEGTEQRRGLRPKPRIEMEQTATAKSTTERQAIERRLYRAQQEVFDQPIWWRAQAITNSTFQRKALAGDDAYIWMQDTTGFSVGGFAMIYNRSVATGEVVQLARELSSGFEVVRSDIAWPEGSMIAPVLSSRMADGIAMKHITDQHGEASLRVDCAGSPLIEFDDGTLQTYRGQPLLVPAHDWTEEVADEGINSFDRVDHGGSVSVMGHGAPQYLRRSISLVLDGTAAIDWFRGFFAHCAGSRKAFWMPSGVSDLTLAATALATDTTIQVVDNGFDTIGLVHNHSDFTISLHGGQSLHLRPVGVTVSNGIATLELSSLLGVNISPWQCRRISFLRQTRFDSDALEIAHVYQGMATVKVAVRTIPETPPGLGMAASWPYDLIAMDATDGAGSALVGEQVLQPGDLAQVDFAAIVQAGSLTEPIHYVTVDTDSIDAAFVSIVAASLTLPIVETNAGMDSLDAAASLTAASCIDNTVFYYIKTASNELDMGQLDASATIVSGSLT